MDTLIKEVQSIDFTRTLNLCAFIEAKQFNPPVSLQAELETSHSECLDNLQEWLMRHCKWDLSKYYPGTVLEFNQMIGQVILFAFLNDLALTTALQTIYPIPGRKDGGKLQGIHFPRRCLVVCNTSLRPTDLASLKEGQDVHGQVRFFLLSKNSRCMNHTISTKKFFYLLFHV